MAAAVSAAAVGSLLLHRPRSAACCCTCWLHSLWPRQALQLAPLKLKQQGVGHHRQATEAHHGACRWEGEARAPAIVASHQQAWQVRRSSLLASKQSGFLMAGLAAPQHAHTTLPRQRTA